MKSAAPVMADGGISTAPAPRPQIEVDVERRLPGFTLNARFTAGERPLGLLGASGAGKTLTLRAITGLDRPERGRIVLNGRVLFDSATGINVPTRERRIGFLFQHYALFPHLTVAENIAFGLDGMAAREIARRVAQQVTGVHLEGLEHRYAHELSGGQQQRVALARALAIEPEALLLDEPLAALDTHLRSRVERQLLETLAGYRGVTVFVTHNLEEAYRVCADLAVLAGGRVAAAGPKEEIFRRPPSLEVAQLTGCKNFSRARAAARPGFVEAVEWGCTLRVEQEPAPNLGWVAIRAHQIEFLEGPPPTAGGENALPAWVAQTSETPQRMTLYLKLHAPAGGPGDYHLQAEVFKEKWQRLQRAQQPWRVRLGAERLFLLSN